MSFKEISGKMNFRKWNDWSEGDVVEGEYLRTQLSTGKYPGKDMHIINVTACSWDDKIVGQDLCLNAAGKLDKNFPAVSKGTKIRATYNGKKEMESGPFAGNEANDVTLEIDQDSVVQKIMDAQEKVNAEAASSDDLGL